jgi:hypothetical protein
VVRRRHPEHKIALLTNNAQYAGQNVPGSVPRGTTAQVTVTMTNNGSTTWHPATGHRLGARGYEFDAAPRQGCGFLTPTWLAHSTTSTMITC